MGTYIITHQSEHDSDFDSWFNLNENNRAHLTSWEELKNKHDVSYKSTFKTICTGWKLNNLAYFQNVQGKFMEKRHARI